jgi:hypothetical protein
MSSSGSNSKLAIFQFDKFITPGVVAKLQLQFEEQGSWSLGATKISFTI